MSITYNASTNFGAKDALPVNDPDKVIYGAEFTTEFNAITAAFGNAAPTASPTFTGTATFADVDINSGAIDGAVIGGSSAAAGTFTVVTYSLSSTNSTATTTLDFGANSSHIVTLVGGTTLAFSNVAAGQTGVIILKQDGTGGHSFTLPATAKTPKGGLAIAQETAANSVSVLSYSVLDASNVLVNYIGDFA